MEVLKLFPLFSGGFDMTSLPSILSLFTSATLTEDKHHILVDINFGSLDLRLDLTADSHDLFKYHTVSGQKEAIGGDIAQVTVTATAPGFSLTALKATGLDAPVKVFLHDLLSSNSQKELADLASPRPPP